MKLPQTPTPFVELPAGHRHVLNKKFLELFVLVALVTTAAYAGVMYWQSQQLVEGEYIPAFTPRMAVTSGWKTYTTTKYGFEIQIPENWIVSDDNIDLDFNSPEKNALVGYVPGPTFDIRLWAFGEPVLVEKEGIRNLQKEVINGLEFTTYIDGADEYSYQIMHKGRAYTFYASNGANILFLKQMLSTLKFTDATPGQFCGGIGAIKCAAGYSCKLVGSYPDAGGTCAPQ